MVVKRANTLVSSIRADAKYKRLKESFDTVPFYQMDTEKLLDEVKTLHKLRTIRRLNHADDETRLARKVIDASANDASSRARLTEILMVCFKARVTLEAGVEALTDYLLVTYSEELHRYKTKQERERAIKIALAPFNRYIQNVGVLEESTQLVVNDIDKGSYTIKNIVEVLRLHTKPEQRI